MPINHVFISLSKIIPDRLTVGFGVPVASSNEKGACPAYRPLVS